METRHYWVDLLRIAAAICVITVHANARWFADLDFRTADWAFANVLMTFAKTSATAIFVMISGYVLLNKEITYKKFYGSRFKRLFIPLVFWSIVYALFDYFFIEHSLQDLVWRLTVGMIATGKVTTHLWFLSMFVWLMMVTPLLNKWIRGERPGMPDMIAIIVIFSIYFGFSSLSLLKEQFTGSPMDWFKSFGIYVIYFVLGCLIGNNKDSIKLSFKALVIAYLAIIATGLVFHYVAAMYGAKSDNLIIGNGTLLGFLSTLVVFTAASKTRLPSRLESSVTWLSSKGFGVYLIHPLVLYFLDKGLQGKIKSIPLYVITDIVLAVIVSFAVVALIRKSKTGQLLT